MAVAVGVRASTQQGRHVLEGVFGHERWEDPLLEASEWHQCISAKSVTSGVSAQVCHAWPAMNHPPLVTRGRKTLGGKVYRGPTKSAYHAAAHPLPPLPPRQAQGISM